MTTSQRKAQAGIALVLTLAFLVIATILVVGFTSSMRTERQAAASLANNTAVIITAQAALDHAIALLDKNIPQPVPPGGSTANPTNWIVSPGLLTLISSTAAAVQIPLSSGNPSSSATSTNAELNVSLSSGTAYSILPTATSLQAAWVSVLHNPSTTASSTNPIVARYAFWIDDENSKIDLNTAYGKPAAAGYTSFNSGSYAYGTPSFVIPSSASLPAPTYDNPVSLGLPSSINLDVISGVNRDALATDRVQHEISVPADFARYAGGSSAYDQNKFWLTTASRDPEFNVFGKSRIFLTDSTFQLGDNASGTFINSSAGFAFASEPSTTATTSLRDSAELLTFHSDGNTGASTSTNAAKNPVVAAVNQVATALNSKWPGYQHTFVEKWSSTPGTADAQGQREAQQVAWNIYGMAASASTETTNGIWCNQTPASPQPAPSPIRFAAMLWDGPKPDPTWPTSRILPQTRSPYISKMAVSFIATQFTRPNSGSYATDAAGKSLKGTTKYLVNVRFNPQIYFPLGYQGTQTFDSSGNPRPWNAANDEIYITHFEATIDDGGGSGGQVVRWGSEAPTYDNSLYWDPNGGTYLYKFNANGVLTPSDKTYDFATAQAPWDFSSKDNTVKPSSTPPPGYTARSIVNVFDSGSSSRPCKISNVKIRFLVTTGTGSSITPYQISPMRDIDGAPGFEPSNAQSGSVKDSGAIVFPSFQIPTTNISSNTPEYWMTMETLDPRINQHGTTVGASTSNDDWQALVTTPSILPPAAGSRSGRLAAPYPVSSSNGDESKLAWLDASPYVVVSGTKTRWGMRPSHANRRLSSIGVLSCVSAGIQSGIPWKTLRFQPSTDDPPDWLLLDLFANPINRTQFNSTNVYPAPSPTMLTYMNSTAGKININSGAFPAALNLSSSTRDLPLKALFHNMYRPQVGPQAVAQPDEAALARSIATYLANKSNHVFEYAGEICQVPGVADAGNYDWEKEALIRNLAGLMTTRSNSFSVFGVAQLVKKNPINTNNPGVFQTRADGATADDVVTGEKRFRAIVERYVWPGVDGVAGNGSTNGTGPYNQLGATSYLGSPTNTVDVVDPTAAAFNQGFNPGAASMRYRVKYFEYLN